MRLKQKNTDFIGNDILCKLNELKDFFMSWPVPVKIGAPVSILALAVSGTMLLTGPKLSASTVKEEEIEVSETEDTETALRVEKPIVPQDNVHVTVPSFVKCSLVGESIEKDLTVYLEDEQEDRVEGIEFSIKLTKPEAAQKLKEQIEGMQKIQEQMEAAKNEENLPTVQETELKEELAALSLYEQLACQKKDAIQQYGSAVESIEGEVYVDDDKDGMIHMENLEPGEYVVCFIPVGDYDAENYVVNVEVKKKVEYKAVETIKKKVVSAAEAGDTKKEVNRIPEETVRKDTVEYVEPEPEADTKTYTEWKKEDILLAVSLSDQMDLISRVCEITVESVPDTETETDNTEAGTENTEQTETTEQQEGAQEAAKAEGAMLQTAALAPAVLPKEVRTVTSQLGISQSVTLYANTYAMAAEIPAVEAEVSEIEVVLSDSLSKAVSWRRSEKGYEITVTDPAQLAQDLEGSLTLRGRDAAGDQMQVCCKISVVGGNCLLKNDKDQMLFIKDESGEIVEATVGNYRPDNYYCMEVEQQKKIGWQKIGGETYFFDTQGNKVTGLQVIQGVEYHFDPSGKLLTAGYGIDVSKWQGEINWKKASSVISFSVIRCAFRGTSGKLAEDPKFYANAAGASKNGVKVGLYVYSRAMNEVQAVEEASLAVRMAQEAGCVSLPIYIDMEDDCQLSLSRAKRDAIVLAFCKTVQNSGYTAGVYANRYWLTDLLTPSKYSGISIWCAQFGDKCTYTGRYNMWQYSERGRVPGISEYVDLDRSYF